MQKLGSFTGNWEYVTDDLKNLLNKHRSDIAEKLGFEIAKLEGDQYKTQIVNGTNQKNKAKDNGNKEIQVVIHVPLGENPATEVIQCSK